MAIGGAASFGEHVGDTGQLLAEESPEELLEALTGFLAAYRDALAQTAVR